MSDFDFTSFLKLMVHKQASDLFITAGVAPSLKVQGRVVPITQSPLSAQQSRDMVLNVMTPAQREEFEKTHECQFAISASGIGRFRVSCFYQRNCVGMVLRRIESKIPTPEELTLPPVIKQLAMTKRGIIIFVGGTGTGKSTSLASMIGYRNQNSTGHIITIEDPIEYVHKHEGCIITQREIGIDTDSWENALKNTLRQAPDVIMIGEVRTRETMEHAINFSETGHLCLCTLHANNANQALDRILHFFPEDRRQQLFMDLSLNLKGIVAQQLIPTPDGKARRVAVEVLLGTPLAQDYIRQGEIHKLKELMRDSNQLGMRTFDQSLVELYHAGEISYEDALRHADSSNEVRLRIKLAQGGDAHTLSQGLDGVEIDKANDRNTFGGMLHR
ncbi:twitching motility protein PilU [Luteibacter sp. UNCMF331Sha3.1]|uniref:PilT/PilU family type 4a pilus ATPase n=1 Tax=Luteibacter sp. UNCMF331Sha3.1 TaxID=1502760 RepID=UPI0008D036CE|nr:PilT/PilU family type 4a pilus ATPase [Luteibacter sp. UNCMF331Sha3.1]SEM26658.1 twitching motility protein PilU [Luteibacter sp. UNCMF331Sha3.1]